jgi:hypothetical protein
MPMQFDEFVRQLDGAVRSLEPKGALAGSDPQHAAWTAGERRADIKLVPPMNISLALGSPGRADVTTWYPVDAALVPVVSRRIAGFLSES